VSNEHPAESDLLLYVDGEIGAPGLRSIRAHLDACWTCRMRASEMQAAIVAYASEREKNLVDNPPRPWKDLRNDFQMIRRSAPPSLLRRIRSGAIFRAGRVAVFCGAGAALAALGWLVLSDSPQPIPTPREVTTASPVIERPAIRELPEIRAVPLARRGVTRHEEVAILAELHRLKADLGEPVELKVSAGGDAVLAGAGLAPERIQVLREALSKFPKVRLDFSQASIKAPTAESGSLIVSRARPIAFEPELLRFFGGRPALQNATNSILDASDSIVMYAHALDNVEQRFSADRRAALDNEDRETLDRIQSAVHLRVLMEPLFETLKVEPAPRAKGTLLDASLSVDHLLNAALTGAHSGLTDAELYRELRGWCERLRELLQ